MGLLRAGLLAVLAAFALVPAQAGAQSAPRRALIVFVAGSEGPAPTRAAARARVRSLLDDLAARPGLAYGLSSATQGNYSDDQAVLDVTQGARVSPTAFEPRRLGTLRLVPRGRGGVIAGWDAAVSRAETAPAAIRPGLFAGAIPGGAAYAGAFGADHVGAVAAADRRGHVAAVSLGPAATLPARAQALLRDHRLVVVSLPAGQAQAGLDALLARRAPGELVLVTAQPPDVRTLQFLPLALTAASERRGITSDTTQRDGVVTHVDIAPTVLDWLGLRVPGAMTGDRIRTATRVSAGDLVSLRTRYEHVAPRRIRALQALLGAWALLVAGLALLRRARAGLRIGALAFLWVPAVVLVPGVVDPSSANAEALIVTALAFALGALTDRVLGWPRGPLLPAAVALAVYVADLIAGSALITQSLLGPNPRAGARFYGIGNELEPALPILLFLGLAAAMGARPQSRRLAAVFGGSGLVLALIIGSGLLGADVGGVITASVGAAVAAMLMVPGGVSRRSAIALLVALPFVAVGALALLDLVTGAESHFSRNVLKSEQEGNLADVITRRYDFAYHALTRGRMPFVASFAAAAAVAALLARDRLYSDLPGPAWRAALLGGLACGVAGALSNDSGPLLFVVAVFVLGVATAYLHGAPRPVHAAGTLDDDAQDVTPLAAPVTEPARG